MNIVLFYSDISGDTFPIREVSTEKSLNSEYTNQQSGDSNLNFFSISLNW